MNSKVKLIRNLSIEELAEYLKSNDFPSFRAKQIMDWLWKKNVGSFQEMKNNLNSLNENPLGVAALTGTSFNIDRNYTTKKLGFKVPTSNSIDTVSDRDFVLDFLYSVSVCSMHMSRIAEDLIIWSSDGFNLIHLSDKIVTGSSIMPQKKNPDLIEYLIVKSGSAFVNLF